MWTLHNSHYMVDSTKYRAIHPNFHRDDMRRTRLTLSPWQILGDICVRVVCTAQHCSAAILQSGVMDVR